MESANTTTYRGTSPRKESLMASTVSIFAISILNGRKVVDREQLALDAFTAMEAHAVAERIRKARGAERYVVVRHELPAQW
jgi:hypothetical protein